MKISDEESSCVTFRVPLSDVLRAFVDETERCEPVPEGWAQHWWMNSDGEGNLLIVRNRSRTVHHTIPQAPDEDEDSLCTIGHVRRIAAELLAQELELIVQGSGGKQ